MEKKGYNRNIIVLTRPKNYRKKNNSATKVFKFLLHRYPTFSDALLRRYKVYNHQMDEIDKREKAGTSLVIRPPKSLGISRTENNPDELERVYQMGRREAERMLPKIREFLAS